MSSYCKRTDDFKILKAKGENVSNRLHKYHMEPQELLLIVWWVTHQGSAVTTQETHQNTTTNQFSLITMRIIILFPSIVLANSPSSNCDKHNG